MFSLGMGECLIILFLAFLFIGPKKLPELAKSLGKGIRDFQKAKNGLLEDIEQENTPEKVSSSARATSQAPNVEHKKSES